MGYIYIYKYIFQKVAICSLWTVRPCYVLSLVLATIYVLAGRLRIQVPPSQIKISLF